MGSDAHLGRHETARRRGLVAWAALVLVLAPAGWARADGAASAPAKRTVVRVGVLAHRGVGKARAEWGPTMDYLSAALPSHRFTLVPLLHGNDEINRAVAAGKVDFVFTTPANYVELEAACGATRIATLRLLQNGVPCTSFGGVIFTRADRTDIRTLDDLRGKTFAAYDRHAFGGWWMAWRELLAAGIVPDQDFAVLHFTGGVQDDVVRAVLAGRYDAGTVRADLLVRLAGEGQIKMADVRVINRQPATEEFPFVRSTRLYPEWPAAAMKATNHDLARQVAIALMQMPPDCPAAQAAACAGWTVPQDYSPVHDLMRELRLGPYVQYGTVTPAQAARQYWSWLVAAGALLLLLLAVVIRQYRRARTLERLEARAAGPAAACLTTSRTIRWLPRAAALGVLALGALALGGWAADIAYLKSIVPGLKAMNPTSSCLYLLAGAALLIHTSTASRPARAAAGALAALVALAGLLRLAGYLGADLGVDRLLFSGLLGPNRMAPTTAACFLLGGTALLLIDLATRGGQRPADWLTLAAAALPLVALLGYIFQARFLYTIGSANPMALNSAAAMFLLCLGVLCARPDRGLMAVIAGGTAGGVVLRTLLPAAVGVPVALGVLRMTGQQLGLFNAQVGVSLLTLSTIVVLLVLIWWNAGLLHRLDLRRRQAEDELRRAHDELERRVEDRTVELQEANRSLTREIAERRKAQGALTHLNAVLRSIQHINQLVIREQDATALAWRACQTLTGTRGYEAAWIALPDPAGTLLPAAHSGLEKQFPGFVERMRQGQKPACFRAALAAAGVFRVAAEPAFCHGCCLDGDHPGRQALVVRLEHAGIVNGVLAVYATADWVVDQQELGLLEELAGDIALALHKMTVEAQKSELEQRYLQAQKMEAIGRLAGGVAHDFRNQLTVIGGYAELVLLDLPPDSPHRERLAEIRKAAQRSAELTGQLLAFSRRQMLTPEVVNLNDVLADMARPLATMIGEDIELTLAPAPGLGNVRVDRAQLEQAIMNIVANARDAMPNGGTLTLATAEANPASAPPEVAPGPYVRLAVSDTGIGMDQAVLARIFEPYFTTKEKGKGTGLGLSMVYGFVSQSGGWVHVDSAPGEGTTVAVYIPRVADAAPAPAPLPPAAPAPTGHETILVAEDEPAVRDFVVSTLRYFGYRVLDAANAADALALAAGCPDRIHLLLTDVVMPRMSGPQLAERLAVTRPDTKVLFMSGYASGASEVPGENPLAPGAHHITKPFSPDALAEKIRLLLER